MTDAREQAHRHVLPHYTKGAAWKSEDLAIIERGEGCYVWDTDGNKYLDGLAGLFCTNLGHGRSDLTSAAAKQMDRLAFYPNWGFASPPTIEAASIIAGVAPGDLSEVFFVSSGSEAVESALKFARNYHLARGDESRYKVIARNWAYHGTTLGALTVTGIPKFRDAFAPLLWDGVRHVPNTRQCASEAGGVAGAEACAQVVDDMILAEGPDTVAMVIAEPVQNGGGALVPPDGYWQELRRVCDKHGVLLCADEVICGFGRFGHWFASERFDVVPDMMTFAKGVTSAYQPLGGFVARESLVQEIWDSSFGMYNHGSTFGGHPVATAVAVANMRAMGDEDIFGHVLAHEDYFTDALARLTSAHGCVREIRGTGYFYAVDLMRDRESGTELAVDEAAELPPVLNGYVKEAGVLVRPDDRGYTGLTISPPLVADRDVIDDLVNRLDQVLDRTEAWLNGDRSPVR